MIGDAADFVSQAKSASKVVVVKWVAELLVRVGVVVASWDPYKDGIIKMIIKKEKKLFQTKWRQLCLFVYIWLLQPMGVILHVHKQNKDMVDHFSQTNEKIEACNSSILTILILFCH